MVTEFLKLFGVLLVAATKFLYSSTSAYLAGYSFIQTVLATFVGGVIGVYVFYRFGRLLTAMWNRRFPPKKEKQNFTKRSRRLIELKNSYGLYGLAFLTPCIISIPIGCLIAAKYYQNTVKVMLFMSIAVMFWSLLLSTITFLIGPIFG